MWQMSFDKDQLNLLQLIFTCNYFEFGFNLHDHLLIKTLLPVDGLRQ